jgi:hypothetical protein
VKYLGKVGSGTLNLSLDAGNVAQATVGGPKAEGTERVFSRESLSDYTGG